MRVTLITVGSQGDVQPCIALGVGLKSHGHEVRVVTHADFKPAIESYGLGFSEVTGNPRGWLDTEEGLNWLESGLNVVRFYRGLKRFLAPVLQSLSSYLPACRGSEAILYCSLAIGGPHAGEKLGCPSFPLMLHPTYPTSEFPSVLAWSGKPRPRGYNLVTHFITEQTINLATRSVVNRWRRQELGLPREPWAGNFQRQRRRQVPIFLGYSQHVLPRPADWGENVHVTGYWFLPIHADWQPPPAVVEFLQSGPPPVYVGFGSLSVRSPVEFTRVIVSALKRSGRRGLLSRGWGNLGGIPLPKTILRIESIPHEWLFPQVAAVVHHGGCGTTAAGLRSGVPTITIPFFADQFLWAERVVALGAGPDSVPYASLTAEKLAQAIRTATGDPAVRAAAQGIGSRLRAENGVENMVASFERCMKRK